METFIRTPSRSLMLAILFSLLCVSGWAKTATAEASSLCEESFSSTVPVIKRKGYILFYDGRTKNALWVYERLSCEGLDGNADRKYCRFKEDPLIPKILRSTDADFVGSGFDRGHLCPAGDQESSQEAMVETFYLSNISPQELQFNRGYWSKVERHIRGLTKRYKTLHVYTGPLYLPYEEDGKRYVKYQVIGKNDVAVPTHFFKVIFAVNGEKTVEMAYIFPNRPIPAETPLESFKVTIEKIEKAAGIIYRRKG